MTAAQSARASVEGVERLELLAGGLRGRELDVLLVCTPVNLRYLTGYAAMPLERLTMLVVRPAGQLIMVVPRLEKDPAGRSPAVAGGFVEVVTWEETEDPHRLVAAAVDGASETGRRDSKSGFSSSASRGPI